MTNGWLRRMLKARVMMLMDIFSLERTPLNNPQLKKYIYISMANTGLYGLKTLSSITKSVESLNSGSSEFLILKW